jgi:hypothetical protein
LEEEDAVVDVREEPRTPPASSHDCRCGGGRGRDAGRRELHGKMRRERVVHRGGWPFGLWRFG